MTKTADIFATTAPYNNPYQNQDEFKRLLFVCSAGLLRSATGANLYSSKGYNTRAAGSHPYALVPVSANLVNWADVIIFVNSENYEQTLKTFSLTDLNDVINSKVRVLDIPDNFSFMEKGLVNSFEQQLGSDV